MLLRPVYMPPRRVLPSSEDAVAGYAERANQEKSMSEPVKATAPKILDMKPTGRYSDGSPTFSFHTSFPSRGVRAVKNGDLDQQVAYQQGVEAVRSYERADPYGNMGECLGVTKGTDGLWHAVINTFHSNT